MRIAFDARPLLSDTKSGVGYNEHGLVSGLISQYPGNRYSLEFFSWKGRAGKLERAGAYRSGDVEMVECRWFPGGLYRMASAILPIPYAFFFPRERDVTHFFNYYVPPFVRGGKVVTVHDMAFRVCPETVRLKTRLFLGLVLGGSIRRADRVVTVSEFSRQEILRFYHLPPEKVVVVPNGVDAGRFHPGYGAGVVKGAREKYGIGGRRYFLSLGNLEPRKNLVRLVRAYGMFRKRYMEGIGDKEGLPLLAIAGGKGWMYGGIFREVKKEGLEGDVAFTGYVADTDVPALMAGADLFCFPSLYEGFGMPVLEAMACGTPVLASDIPALREVVGDAGILVDPLSARAIASGMERLYSQDGLAGRLRRDGPERARGFSWAASAERLMGVYQGLSRGR